MFFDEFRPHDAIREAGIILDVRRQRKLSAGFVAVQNQRFQVCAPGVNRSS